jgi:UTP--glucose-1-phosphate uridylyltransferase
LLGKLLDRGFEYAFVSNADNLGAVLDVTVLGFMAENGHDFVMEVADRTAADRKGGHLCRLSNGRLGLRESAQCHVSDEKEFQDVERHSYFNTNNLWLHLPTLARILEDSGGFLPLPTIVNRKTLDPRDPSSPPVLQLETAMGAAISLFERAAAVRVPRTRFSPVKNTNDLLAVRSDAYQLSGDFQVVLEAGRSEPPLVLLDERHFRMIDAFEEHFPSGAPSLRRCSSLRVDGDVIFGRAVTVEGDAIVRAADPGARIPDEAHISGELEL